MAMWSESAEELIMGTIATESRLGHYIKQVGGPALGIMQMEPITHDFLATDYLPRKPAILAKILAASGAPRLDDSLLMTNPAYAVAMGRVYYWTKPEALPFERDVNGLALYWKIHWNTPQGKGDVGKFIDDYRAYVSDG
jgi:hypothetical protein